MKIQEMDLDTAEWQDALETSWVRITFADGTVIEVHERGTTDGETRIVERTIRSVDGQILVRPRASNEIEIDVRGYG